jgi:hypothetical protein
LHDLGGLLGARLWPARSMICRRARGIAAAEPWVAGPADDVITISTEMMHGYRMVPARLADQIDPATSITGKRLP